MSKRNEKETQELKKTPQKFMLRKHKSSRKFRQNKEHYRSLIASNLEGESVEYSRGIEFLYRQLCLTLLGIEKSLDYFASFWLQKYKNNIIN